MYMYMNICRYGIHFYDLRYEGVWEKRGTIMYYTDLIMELLALCVDFAHHFHMLVGTTFVCNPRRCACTVYHSSFFLINGYLLIAWVIFFHSS